MNAQKIGKSQGQVLRRAPDGTRMILGIPLGVT